MAVFVTTRLLTKNGSSCADDVEEEILHNRSFKNLKISLFVGKGHSKKAVTVRFIEEYLVFKWWAYTKMSILHSVNLRRWKEIEFCHLASGP